MKKRTDLETKEYSIYDFQNMSQAEIISIHINNLILTYGHETVKETLRLFNFKYINYNKSNKKTDECPF